MDELWVCLDCDHTGHLATNGSCERCGSQAVATLQDHADNFKDIVLKNVTVVTGPAWKQLPDGSIKRWWSLRIYVGEDDQKWPLP